EDARLQLVLAVGACRVAHHALVVGQLAVEQQRIVPVEGGLTWRSGMVHGSSWSLSVLIKSVRRVCRRAGPIHYRKHMAWHLFKLRQAFSFFVRQAAGRTPVQSR